MIVLRNAQSTKEYERVLKKPCFFRVRFLVHELFVKYVWDMISFGRILLAHRPLSLFNFMQRWVKRLKTPSLGCKTTNKAFLCFPVKA